MEKQKHIWIVNYYTAPPEFTSNPRHLEFTHYLQKAGYKVTIFSAGKKFVEDYNGKSYKEVQYGEYKFVHIKVPEYQGNGLRRMFSIWRFAKKIYRYRNRFERPDIIYQNMHAPFDTVVSMCAKKLKARYIAEAWDLWPSNFVTFGLISAKNPVMKWAYAQERKMYDRANDIIFSFQGGLDYLRQHHLTNKSGGKINESNVFYINNGINLKEFDDNKNKYLLNDPDLENENLFKIVYLGSIRLVNDIKQLIDAISLLQKYQDIRLFIYGNGNQREELIQYCKTNHINNVTFKKEWISIKYVPYVMGHSDLNILNYKKGFGDYGISSEKLFQSLAAGKPIVCNIDIAYDDIITDNNLGHAGWLDSAENYAKEILKIYDLYKNHQNAYRLMCERVRKTAEQFDYEVLFKKIIEVLE